MRTLTSFAPRRASAGSPRATTTRLPTRDICVWAARRYSAAVVSLIYVLAALALTWRLWADPASRVVAGNPHDADLFAWFMRYAAAAVRHGRLPGLVTTGMNAPFGVNLMWNTPVLLPGILLAPVTGLLGPQVSLTVLITVGFAGSALALFWVLRRWGVGLRAAALGGAVYGFSPALLQSAIGHYDLQLAVLPPLIIDAGLRVAVGRLPVPGRAVPGGWLTRLPAPLLAGAWLGLLVAAQLFISEEIALFTGLTGVLIVAVLAAARPRLALRRAWPAAAGLLIAAIVTAVLAGHALWTQFRGPLLQHGALYPPDYYVNDLTSFVTPQSSLLLHTAASAAAAARYQGGAAEYLGYLGWPLLAVLAIAAVVSWRRPAGRATAVTFAALVLLSLGGHPLISGHAVQAVNLPWHWIEELPVLATALPDRLSILADGAAAALLAIGIDEASARLSARNRQAPAQRGGSWPVRAPAAVLAVAVISCLPLLPRPLPAERTLPLPAGWSSVFARLHLVAGTRVLVVPVSFNYMTPGVRWSADTGEPAVMIGGYFIGPGAGGQAYLNGAGITPTTWYLDKLWAAGLRPGNPFVTAAEQADLPTATAKGPAELPAALAPAQVDADLTRWRPAAVVANAAADSPLGRYLSGLFGPPAVQVSGMLGWRI